MRYRGAIKIRKVSQSWIGNRGVIESYRSELSSISDAFKREAKRKARENSASGIRAKLETVRGGAAHGAGIAPKIERRIRGRCVTGELIQGSADPGRDTEISGRKGIVPDRLGDRRTLQEGISASRTWRRH